MSDLVNTLDKIFANRMFRIPDYQRGYAWQEKQWKDLIQDLELLPAGRDHYTGTLVLCATGEDDGTFQDAKGWNYSVSEVIDGQQRLTTALLLLDAIRTEMGEIPDLQNRADGLWMRYLAVEDDYGQWRTKLALNQDCQQFYAHDILRLAPSIEGPTIRSHRLLAEAHAHFAAYLGTKRAELGPGYVEWLRALYEKITQHLTFIVYEVDDENDANIVFETMNDRGIDLTELEKVKNYLLYLASKLDLPEPHSLRVEVNATWKHIFERLMASGLADHEDRLLRAHWLMAYDPDRRNWRQSRSIKDRFSLSVDHARDPELLRKVQDYLGTLKMVTTAYCDIHAPRHPIAFNDCADPHLRSEIAYLSEKLARLGARAGFLPLLMAVRLRARDGGQTYLKVVELCEKFDFRVYQWLGYRSGAGQPRLFQLGYRFFHDGDAGILLYELSTAILHYCPNERFRERFSRETENWYAWYGLKYFLYEYEQYLAQKEKEPVHVRWDEIWDVKRDTIEHVLPQTPAGAYWLDRFTDEQRQRWTNDIGNLTLTYDNSCLGNKPFPGKKGDPTTDCSYATSKLFIEQQLARYEEWTEKEIRERREQFRDWAIERWCVQVPEPVIASLEGQVPKETEGGVVKETAKQRLLRLADAQGTGAAFRTVFQTAMRYPEYLYPSMRLNWWVVLFASPKNKMQALFYLSPGLWVGVNYANWERFHRIPADEARSILRAEPDATLDPGDVEGFVERLERLMARVQEIAGGSR